MSLKKGVYLVLHGASGLSKELVKVQLHKQQILEVVFKFWSVKVKRTFYRFIRVEFKVQL